MRIKQLLTCIALTCLSATAFAQNTSTPDTDGECLTNADCPTGFQCELFDIAVSCAPCPDDGSDCEPCPDPGPSYGYCTPPPPQQCNNDSDCATEEVCVTYQYEECSSSGSTGSGSDGSSEPVAPCEDGDDCPDRPPEVDPAPVTCTTGSESYCVPQYIAPCQQDADCGAGFSCNDIEICSCTVSGGSSTDSDGDAPGRGDSGDGDTPSVEPDEDCSCAPSGDKYCELNEVACDSDTDCSGSLVCEDFGGGTIGVEIACDSDEPCETDPLPPEPITESYCAPEGYGGWANAGVGGTERLEAATGQDLSSESDSIQWGDDGRSGSKASDDGCSSTNATPNWFTPALLLVGLFSLRRRREAAK